MKRFFSVILFLGYTSISIAQHAVEMIQKEFLDASSSVVLVAAHRAAHQNYPENSLPAIQKAIDLGVDIVELDVKVTKDGVAVLMHDRTIDRTTTGKGEPSEYTLEELQKFKLLHDGKPTNLHVPTFDAALKLTKNKVMVDIDIKTDKLDPILDAIKANECDDQVFFFDDDYYSLQYVRSVDKGIMLMPRAYSYAMADSAIVMFSPQVVHIDFSFYDPEVSHLIKSNNARIWINALGKIDREIGTPNEDEAMDEILKYGANVIQTDKPELLKKALQKRNLHP